MVAESKVYSLVVVLTPTRSATVGATAGHQAHAAFLRTIEEADPALSAALHEASVRVRPFTVSPLLGVGRARGNEVALAPGADCFLRFTVLHASIYERFMARFLHPERRPLMRLGQAELLVKEIRATPGSHPWAGYASWEGLARAARPEPEVTLEFASPTAFSFGQKEWGKKTVVLPEPGLVFGSLARTWNAFAPAPLQVEWKALGAYLEGHGIVKRIVGLETQMLRFQRSPQVGFRGQVTYGFPGQNEVARLQLNLLAAFAFYGGVGMKTTMGMGQCRVVPHGR